MKDNYWQNKKVLVTGASGFIGSHFVEELSKKGSHIKAVFQTENKNIKLLKKISKNIKFIQLNLLEASGIDLVSKDINVLINCAALDGNTEFKQKYAALILDTNMRITSNILNAAVNNKIQNTVLLSSAEVYPLTAKNPIKEDDDYKRNFDNTSNGYVLSKRYAEILGELYEKQYGINVYLPRLTNVYGPRDKFDEATNRVIPSMIKKLLNKETIDIWGNGKQVRQFIYIKDVINQILNLVEANEESIVNIASNEAITIHQLALTLLKIIDENAKILINETKPGGIKERILDTSKIFKINHKKNKDLIDGLKETCLWYSSQKHE